MLSICDELERDIQKLRPLFKNKGIHRENLEQCNRSDIFEDISENENDLVKDDSVLRISVQRQTHIGPSPTVSRKNVSFSL